MSSISLIKIKISSLFATYIIFNQINFQRVFAQSSNETYKPSEDFYSIVLTALILLAVSILDKIKEIQYLIYLII